LPSGGNVSKLPGGGGIFNTKNMSLFSYAALNPLVVIDPDGNVNVFIGGADDCARKGCSTWLSGESKVYASQGSMLNAVGGDTKQGRIFYTWDEAKQDDSIEGFEFSSKAFGDIKKVLHDNPDEPINILGHSWGGDAAISLWHELEEAGIPVANVSTFDPVGNGGPENRPKGSAAKWKNLVPGWRDRSFGSPDFVSGIGGELGQLEGADNYRVDSSDLYKSGHLGVLTPGEMTKIGTE
jgi:pimeloyl-ACP methyl ester carboxylesterase